MPVTGYGPYTVRMIGGCAHGRSFVVASLAPYRLVRVADLEREVFVPPAWNGKAPTGGAADLYTFDGIAQGDGSCGSYTFARVVTR